MHTGLRASTACKTILKAENVDKEEPSTSKDEQRATCSFTRFTRSAGTFSPKKTTSGLRKFPHSVQLGITNDLTSSWKIAEKHEY